MSCQILNHRFGPKYASNITRPLDRNRIIALSYQKFQREAAIGEPNLHRLLAHVSIYEGAAFRYIEPDREAVANKVKVRSCGDPPPYTKAQHRLAAVTVRELELADEDGDEGGRGQQRR